MSVVICVLFRDFGYGKTRKSRRTTGTDGGSLLGKTGLALETAAILKGLLASGNLTPQDLTLTPKRDPKSPPRATKRNLKNGSIDTGPQTDTQKGPQISTPVPQKDHKKRKYRHRGGDLILHN